MGGGLGSMWTHNYAKLHKLKRGSGFNAFEIKMLHKAHFLIFTHKTHHNLDMEGITTFLLIIDFIVPYGAIK